MLGSMSSVIQGETDPSPTLERASAETQRRWLNEFPGESDAMVQARDLLYQLLHFDPEMR